MVRPDIYPFLMLQDGVARASDTVGCSLDRPFGGAWPVCRLRSGSSLAGGGMPSVEPHLRSENARLKDQLLVAQTQNRDFADRAEDDARRLAKLGRGRLSVMRAASRHTRTSVAAWKRHTTSLHRAWVSRASKADERLSQASPAPAGQEEDSPRSSARSPNGVGFRRCGMKKGSRK